MLVVETADLELPDQVGDAGFLEPLHSLTGPIDIVDHDHQVVAERLDGFVLRLPRRRVLRGRGGSRAVRRNSQAAQPD